MIVRWSIVPATAMLAACAAVQPTAARREVGALVEQRAGVADAIPEQQDADSRARVRARVAALMARPLTVERALQVALLNNRELRATLEQLGVAQADLVQAGLLQNPVISRLKVTPSGFCGWKMVTGWKAVTTRLITA